MGGLDGPPKPPGARKRPGTAVALLELALRPWGLAGPPKPPALGSAPAQPWRSSTALRVPGASTGPHAYPASLDAERVVLAALDL